MKAAVLWLAAIVLLAQPSWAQALQPAEVSLQRHFQLPGLLPAEGQYVSYSATVKNTGSTALLGMHLWVTFGPAVGSGDSTSFAVPDLQPGESRQLSLGPFKMVKSGEHRLYIGINKSGNAAEPNDVALNYSSKTPADSLTVYGTGLIAAISAGAAFTIAGGALVALYIKKRRP